jgi:pyruvate,water dikinase
MDDGHPIVWLGREPAHDPRLSGGKGAALSRLAGSFSVPAGFCITAPALASLAPHDTLPAPLLSALAAAYDSLRDGTGDAVAVRSSAVDEDGHACSFAGLHETCLNVRGLDRLADAVVRCIASGRSERARSYRRDHGLPPHAPIAVVVQRMIQADVAAVAFSADPVTGDRTRIVINASWGLGESIVGGTVTPDVYSLDARSGAVTGYTPGAKERMTIVAEEGTIEVDVPGFLRRERPLTDEQAVRIATMVSSLERTAGFPVDVECALRDDELWLLQCRPITTLAAVTAGGPEMHGG